MTDFVMFEAFRENFEEARDRKGSLKIWPSEVAGCMRRMALRLRGYESTHPFKPETRLVMNNGIAAEQQTHNILKEKYGVDCAEQFGLRNDFWSGKVDFVLYPHSMTPILIEHKAVNPRWFDYKGGLPREDHAIQLVVYQSLYEEIFKIRPEIRLFYRGWEQLAEFSLQVEKEQIVANGRVGTLSEYEVRHRVFPIDVFALMHLAEEVWYLALHTEEPLPDVLPLPDLNEQCTWRGRISCPYFGHCFDELDGDWISKDANLGN